MTAYRIVAGARGDVDAARRAAVEGAVAVVASPAAVKGLIAAIGSAAFARARVVAIGPTTARSALDGQRAEPRVVRELTADAILRELEERDVAHR